MPALKPREVVQIHTRLGFAEVRPRGSHRQFNHGDGRITTVPLHTGRGISPTLLRHMARDIRLTLDGSGD